jgi:uncharacterized protein (TIGR03067 family)
MKVDIKALGKGGGATVHITFEASGVSSTSNGVTNKGTWKINSRTNPRTMDLTTKHDNKTSKGIYKLENGELILFIAQPGKPRPRGFQSASLGSPLFHLKPVQKKK